jgi:hypothetical protein
MPHVNASALSSCFVYTKHSDTPLSRRERERATELLLCNQCLVGARVIYPSPSDPCMWHDPCGTINSACTERRHVLHIIFT